MVVCKQCEAAIEDEQAEIEIDDEGFFFIAPSASIETY